jgi:hypothetical protein
MSPRKAVVVGTLLLLGSGAALVAYSGPLLYHWHVTGELWVFTRFRGSYYTTYSNSPFPVLHELLIYGTMFAFGVTLIVIGLYAMVHYWPRLIEQNPPSAD